MWSKATKKKRKDLVISEVVNSEEESDKNQTCGPPTARELDSLYQNLHPLYSSEETRPLYVSWTHGTGPAGSKQGQPSKITAADPGAEAQSRSTRASPESEWNMRADLARQLKFPQEITAYSLQQDVMLWLQAEEGSQRPWWRRQNKGAFKKLSKESTYKVKTITSILHEAVTMNETTEVTQVVPHQTPVKALLSILPCLLFLYVNGVMLFALLRKPLLLESSRYILFGHLLFTDSLQLLVTMLLYIFAVTMVRMISYVCIIFTLLAAIVVKMSPLNLAVMSLERYVAICFPLRHADIATTRATGMAIAVMWTAASLDSFTQLFLFVSLENTSFIVPRFCIRNTVFQLQIYSTLNRAFTILYFVLVSSFSLGA
ncbi:olfactory receptor 1500-like [Toxotes jaculatrix]|uniref:olfactory receptor 1500-like n=1 Tax=Toxotes jaculatrix TaxID=941984 RepID=UPI001B3AFBEE|nr:olfactory receptor 1500-like [Toxotes jaculatrix]